MKTLKQIVLAILLGGIYSCNPVMEFTVKRPAEVNLKNYNQIVIGDIKNPSGSTDRHTKDIADEITAKLVETNRFDVLDRENVNKLMREKQLNNSVTFDENNISELSMVLGSSVMLFGRIQKDTYTESTSKGDPWKDKKGNRHQTFRREGKYYLLVNFKIVDVATSKILATKTLDGTHELSTSADNQAAPSIDQNSLYLAGVKYIGEEFVKIISPYLVKIKTTVQSDSRLPELEQSLAMIKAGEWEDGLNILEEVTKRQDLEPTLKAKALYNYGIFLTYGGQPEKAMDVLKEAIKIVPNESDYNEALKIAKKEKELSDKLKEQQVN